jgi:hypothetical protein
VSADLDALDRGVIEAGQLAAEALSRVAALEAKLTAVYALGFEAGVRRGRNGDPTPATGGPPGGRRHLTAIEGGQQ